HCSGSGPYINPTDGFTPLAFTSSWPSTSEGPHLGAYGNSDPLDVTQWVEVAGALTADTASWNEFAGKCSSVVAALEYRVLYASVGSKENPQTKVLLAEARYGKDDWVWQGTDGDGDEQAFLVCASVSFTQYDQE
ncbi:unnamed protein product, partial [Choristocarpus tenellus]